MGLNSNTTLVKVKSLVLQSPSAIFFEIQIQLLLKLNLVAVNFNMLRGYSNTTLVKVKLRDYHKPYATIRIFKYNSC